MVLSLHKTVYAANFLFVQTAAGATLNDDGTLMLTDVGDKTTYFADRPVRVAGHTSTEDFVAFFEPNGTFSEVCSLLSCTCDTYARLLSWERTRERER